MSNFKDQKELLRKAHGLKVDINRLTRHYKNLNLHKNDDHKDLSDVNAENTNDIDLKDEKKESPNINAIDPPKKYQKSHSKTSKHVGVLIQLITQQPQMYYMDPAKPLSNEKIAEYANSVHKQMAAVNVKCLTSHSLKMKKLLPILIVTTQRALEMQERVKNGQLGAGNYSMTVVNHKNRYPQLEELAGQVQSNLGWASCPFSAVEKSFYFGVFYKTDGKKKQMRLTTYENINKWCVNSSAVPEALADIAISICTRNSNDPIPFIVIDTSYKNQVPNLHGCVPLGAFREIANISDGYAWVIFRRGANEVNNNFALDGVEDLYHELKRNNRNKEAEFVCSIINVLVLCGLRFQEQSGYGFDYNKSTDRPKGYVSFMKSWCGVICKGARRGFKCEHKICHTDWKNETLQNNKWKSFSTMDYEYGNNGAETQSNMYKKDTNYILETFHDFWKQNYENKGWMEPSAKIAAEFSKVLDPNKIRNKSGKHLVSSSYLRSTFYPLFEIKYKMKIVNNGKSKSAFRMKFVPQ